MKSKIFLYLFLFTALLLLFQLYNANSVLRHSTAKQMDQLEQIEALKDSLAVLQIQYESTEFHSLLIQSTGTEKQKTMAKQRNEAVRKALLKYNLSPGNPLFPEAADKGKFLISNILVLNSKWVVAGCSNGQQSGQLLLTYHMAVDGAIQFHPIDFRID